MEKQEWQAEADAVDEPYDEVSAALHARNQAPLPSKAPPASSRRRRGDDARVIQAWTSQNRSSKPPPLPTPNLLTLADTSPGMQTQAAGSSGNGLSKLAAWESEIQQFYKSGLTDEQRAAQQQLDRDHAAREQELQESFRASAFSIARVTFSDSGLSPGWNRAMTSPLRLTRNLVKFQGMSPANLGSVSLLVRYW